MSVKYKEVYFPTAGDAREGARDLELSAEEVVGVPYSFTIAKVTHRGRIYKVDSQYWIVGHPRDAPPRVWEITIPHFALCQVDDRYRSVAITILPRSEEEQREFEERHSRLVNRLAELERILPKYVIGEEAEEKRKLRHELSYVTRQLRVVEKEIRGAIVRACYYHAGGRKAGRVKFYKGKMVGRIVAEPYKEVLNKIKPVPNGLCARFCPQFLKIPTEVSSGYCRAFVPSVTPEEVKHKAKPYRGMSILCLQDPWWAKFWKVIDMSEVRRFWGVG